MAQIGGCFQVWFAVEKRSRPAWRNLERPSTAFLSVAEPCREGQNLPRPFRRGGLFLAPEVRIAGDRNRGFLARLALRPCPLRDGAIGVTARLVKCGPQLSVESLLVSEI
jgi:hypothetical protein